MPEQDVRRLGSAAPSSWAGGVPSLSSLPIAPVDCDQFISPGSTAFPSRALGELLRTEASGVLADVSPHAAMLAPRCTIITVVEAMCCDHCSAFASLLFDHPAVSGSTRSQVVSGKRSAAVAN